MSGAEVQCIRCGYRSTNRAFFRREKAGILRQRKRFCHGCGPYAPTKNEAWSYLAPRAAVVGVLILVVGPKKSELTLAACAFIGAGTIILANFVTIAVHEFGHAAVARLVGMTVAGITLGSGPLLVSHRGKTTAVALRTFLLTGGVTRVYCRDVRPAKWRTALMLLGGAGANCAVTVLGILLVVAWYRAGRSIHPATAVVVSILLLSQIVVIAKNLFPSSVRIGQALVPSDGKRLVELAKSSDFEVRQLMERHLLEGGRLLARGDHDGALRHYENACRAFPVNGLFLTLLIFCVGKVRGARAAAQYYLDRTEIFETASAQDKPGVAAAYMLVAWYALLTSDPELLPLADRLSEEAVATLPDVGRGTRAAVMIRLGQPEASKPILVGSMRRDTFTGNKAEIARFLAGATPIWPMSWSALPGTIRPIRSGKSAASDTNGTGPGQRSTVRR